MDLGIRGKTALVAASSQGLGRAVAEELAGEGARVVICARDEAKLRKAQAEIASATGSPVAAVAADLSELSDVAKVVETGKRQFGSIDILVTNTGGPPTGTFESLGAADWDQAVRQNLNSVLNLVRLVLPGMKEKGWGRILNITSVSVKQPIDNLILSNSVRAAVTGFARTLANEVALFGVTVNNIMPGYTRTARLEALAGKLAEARGVSVTDVYADWETHIPMQRIGTPAEFAGLAAFLVSERAGYITGTSIPVDGGVIRALF